MNNINEKISEMVENEQMPCINVRDLKRKADEYNQNESYKKELYNTIKAINKKITTEAEQGKYLYKDRIDDVNKLGKKFTQFFYDIMEYYRSRSFKVFYTKQLDCSYEFSILWENDIDDNKKCYSLEETYKELQKSFTNTNIVFRKDKIEIKPHGTHEGITILFYGEVWLSIVCLSADNPYMFINSNGDFVSRVESFKELVDIITKQFNSTTDDSNSKKYYNLDKTYEELQKAFNNKNITIRKDKVKTKRYGTLEGIVISFYGEIWMNVTCWDDECEYVFINPDGEFVARLEYYTELIDRIITQFNIITKEQNLDVDQYEYNNIDKTFDYLKNFFNDRNVSFQRIFDTDKNEFIVAAIPYRHRLQIACCNDTKHYCVEDTRDDVRIGDFNTLIKLINIIEGYILD